VDDCSGKLFRSKKAPQKINGREIYHMVRIELSGATTFDWFFKVRDKYESYMDVDGVFPWVL